MLKKREMEVCLMRLTPAHTDRRVVMRVWVEDF